MKEVWLVMEGDPYAIGTTRFDVERVYSSREAAEAYIAKMESAYPNLFEFAIEEREVFD